MGADNKICPNCGRKMKQQFIGLAAQKVGRSGKAFSPGAASCGDWQRMITKSCWLWGTAERVWLWGIKARKIVSPEAPRLGESRPPGQPGRRIWIGGFAGSSLREESAYPTKENCYTGRAAEGQSAGGHSGKIAGRKRLRLPRHITMSFILKFLCDKVYMNREQQHLDQRLLLWYNLALCNHEWRRFSWADRSLKEWKNIFVRVCWPMYEPTDGNNPSKLYKIGPFFIMKDLFRE